VILDRREKNKRIASELLKKLTRLTDLNRMTLCDIHRKIAGSQSRTKDMSSAGKYYKE